MASLPVIGQKKLETALDEHISCLDYLSGLWSRSWKVLNTSPRHTWRFRRLWCLLTKLRLKPILLTLNPNIICPSSITFKPFLILPFPSLPSFLFPSPSLPSVPLSSPSLQSHPPSLASPPFPSSLLHWETCWALFYSLKILLASSWRLAFCLVIVWFICLCIHV